MMPLLRLLGTGICILCYVEDFAIIDCSAGKTETKAIEIWVYFCNVHKLSSKNKLSFFRNALVCRTVEFLLPSLAI